MNRHTSPNVGNAPDCGPRNSRTRTTGLCHKPTSFEPSSPTRWKLRRAVKAVNEVLGALRLEKHPDKTFIGRVEKGFDFLGFHFSRDGLTVAKATIEKFVARATRLYEQEPGEAFASTRLGLRSRGPTRGRLRRNGRSGVV